MESIGITSSDRVQSTNSLSCGLFNEQSDSEIDSEDEGDDEDIGEGVGSQAYAFPWAESELDGEVGDRDDDDSEEEEDGDGHQEESAEENGRFNKSEEELTKLTVKVLQLRLRELKLPVYGLKVELIDRLLARGKSTENINRREILTHLDILFYGLSIVGFGEKRQKVRPALNIGRFKSFFGVESRSVKDLFNELEEEFPDIIYKEVMMSMNWLKLCKLQYESSLHIFQNDKLIDSSLLRYQTTLNTFYQVGGSLERTLSETV